MIIGIDALTIRTGGGITHLKELLANFDPKIFNLKKVILFSNEETLKQIPSKEWLIKISHPLLNRSLIYTIIWKIIYFNSELKKNGCELLFSPGGIYNGNFRPYVSMSQNMLIFEKKESYRYGLSYMRFRLLILNILQKRSFKNAAGIIFLSKYAKLYISNNINLNGKLISIIPHGINEWFKNKQKIQKNIDDYNSEHPFRILYISTVDVYKHQWNVVEAVTHLREAGFDLELTLIGSAYQPALKKLMKSIHNRNKSYIHYLGSVPYSEIEIYYKNSDMFIFASTCENYPNILVEAMASGLPILSSSYGPMQEILGKEGCYFDPLNISDIEEKMKKLLVDPKLRQNISEYGYNLAQSYSWVKTSNDTFSFLNRIYNNFHH